MEEGIIKRALSMNKPLPPKVANAPVLQTGLDLYYTAFLDLCSCRSSGFGMGQIPWTAINDYAVAWEFSIEQTEDLLHHAKALDQAYMEHYRKKHDSDKGKVGRSAPQGPVQKQKIGN